jgi:hypothetical protein
LALAVAKAGNSIAAKMATTAITTSNSTRVNAIDRAVCDLMTASLQTFWPVRHPLHPELSKHELGERQTVLIQNDKKQRSKTQA